MSPSPVYNSPAPGIAFFTPAQVPPAGTACFPQPHRKEIPSLFRSIRIRGTSFHNRIFVSPLCQYSAENGKLTPWHLAHLGGILIRGPGLTLMEATAITPEGRITPEDAGIWSDEQLGPLTQLVEFAHSQNQKIGIQLAHAGRKASTVAPWLNLGATATEEAGGWPDDVWGPSDVPYGKGFPTPKPLTEEGIKRTRATPYKAFVDATKRALKAGFDVIEIHNAHGYLLDSFISPVSNKRTDQYGGSFTNRVRFTLDVVEAVRAIMPSTMPLFLRISATDWLEETLPDEPSWRTEDTVRLAPILADSGVDLLDVSSGDNHPLQKIKTGPAFQAQFSKAVKDRHHDRLLVGTVGSITDGKLAQALLDKEMADVIFVGRHFLKNTGTVWQFAEDLGVKIDVARQIGWGFEVDAP